MEIRKRREWRMCRCGTGEERYRDCKKKANRVDREGRRKIPEVEKWGGMQKKIERGKIELREKKKKEERG
jgi:hypothetical protein